MSDFPQVMTFYSFKGGVGRSMAVLNVAYALAARGRNVLVLDMDLEAPGLSGFLRRHKEIGQIAHCDMVDLLDWAAKFAAAREANASPDRSALPPLMDYVVSVDREKLEPLRPPRGELGRVDVIPVDEERDYYGRLTAQAIGSFDHDKLLHIGRVLNVWLKSREFAVDVPEYYGAAGDRKAKYDYVLVDSRTGVTEIGGLCIGPLSDQLVVFTGLNDQNVAGTHDFLKQVGILEAKPKFDTACDTDESISIHRLDPKPTLIVATPVPSGELKMKEERLAALRAKVGTVVGRLSYHPQLALMETVFVRDHPKEYLALEYSDLVDRIMRLAKDETDLDFDALKGFEKMPRAQQRELADRAIRFCSTPGGSPIYLHYIVNAVQVNSISDEPDFVLLDRICRILAGHQGHFDYDVINHWASVLSAWAIHSTASDLRVLRLDAAMERYNEILAASESSPAQKAQALYNRGVRKGQLEDHQGEIADYTAVLEMPDAPAEQKAQALGNRGVTKGQLEDHQGAIADYTAVLEMPDAPAEQKAKALVNRGVTKGQLEDHQGEIADYTAVLEMPDAPAEQKAKALYNRGVRKGQVEDHQGEIADYTTVLEMPDAPAEQKAKALYNRGVTKGQLEDHQGEIADYTAVLEMPDAPAEQKAQALVGRGWRHFVQSHLDKAAADFRQAISTDEKCCPAYGNLAITLLVNGRTEEALATYERAFALASLKDAAAMEEDLADALEKQESIPGSDVVLDRLAKRRAELHD